jgi:hypothetical protein
MFDLHCSSENVELPFEHIRQLMVSVLLSVFLLISYGHLVSSMDFPPDFFLMMIVLKCAEIFFKNNVSGKKYIIFRGIYNFCFTKIESREVHYERIYEWEVVFVF